MYSMYIVFVAVAAVVVFAVAAAAVGRGDGLEEPFPDLERPYLPDGRVEPADIDDVHFAVSFRGYRMDQVDSVLDRLAGQLVERDRYITRLERMVQVQARQSAMAYSPPRSRAGVDPEPPEYPAAAGEASAGTGEPGPATDRPAAGTGPSGAAATGDVPTEAEETAQPEETSVPGSTPQRGGTPGQ